MRIIRSIKKMQDFSRRSIKEGKRIGFVPTMGALHTGHLSLIRRARHDNDLVVTSIFVNPLQFGPKEDLKKYPRDLNRDAQLCRKEAVDILFYPEASTMYPAGHKTLVHVLDLSDKLCGKSRPGHFRGVSTVVLKLFNIVRPDTVYFGQKDAQQAIIIKKMVSDLHLPIAVKVLSTVRENNGLALSSRNQCLKAQEKIDALVVPGALNLARKLIKNGEKDAHKIIQAMRKRVTKKKNVKIDYISVVDLEKLEPLRRLNGEYLIALAVWIGKTRLIDNIVVETKLN